MKSTDACRLVSQPGDSGMLEYSVKIERSEAAVLCGGVDTLDIEMRRYLDWMQTQPLPALL